jgi:HK97 family phage major capsid protein
MDGASAAVVDYRGLVIAAGAIRENGGEPDVAYIAPADYTGLQLALDAMDRPLLQGTDQGPAPVVAGLRIYQTPALSAGQALLAQANQIVVGLRQDATLAVSGDAGFENDLTKVRVTARADVGVNDLAGLCKITEA